MKSLLNSPLFWQIRCLNCRRSAQRALCRACWQQIESFSDSEALIGGDWPEMAYGPYQGLLRQLLGQTKYHGRAPLAHSMGFYLGEWFRHFNRPIQAIVPIPLHAERLNERGYNQAEALARGLSEALNSPVRPILIRKKLTPALHALSLEERRLALNNCFETVSERQVQKLSGKTLLLVDDIFTTGATLAEAKKTLPTESGLSLTLARTLRQDS